MNAKEATKAEADGLSRCERELSQLMRQAQSGDKAAYRALLQKVEPMARSYITHSLIRSGIAPLGRAEDIVQEALLAIHKKRASYDPAQCFLPWMYAIARYKLIDNLRRGNRFRGQVPLEQVASGELAAAGTDAGIELDVEALLGMLPEKQREVLGLVKLKGLSVAEAAAHTGYSESDVKVSVHRAIQGLKKRLRGIHHEDE